MPVVIGKYGGFTVATTIVRRNGRTQNSQKGSDRGGICAKLFFDYCLRESAFAEKSFKSFKLSKSFLLSYLCDL